MKLTREIAGIIYEACVERCYYCGYRQQPFGDWEIDHMTPRQQGGSDDLHNLTLACKKCNRRKGNRDVEDFRVYIIQRVVNSIADGTDFLMEFGFPDESATQALDLALQAQNLLAPVVVTFFGEANNIPRKSDPRFAPPEGSE